ncbi:hypothetical protein DERP_006336 [Dermatophagoides pteronyssinus]|uniref:Uncharacterized protein n=1 Tax=Dermatophagoides pteronyssinus TaxID=6956 RepID=A0ABQ8IYH4_DERPT|nr:hypothetical protein DERP_006336 [Dermatophagoides pteronyssinus]
MMFNVAHCLLEWVIILAKLLLLKKGAKSIRIENRLLLVLYFIHPYTPFVSGCIKYRIASTLNHFGPYVGFPLPFSGVNNLL